MPRHLPSDDPLIECDLPLGRPDLVAHNELVLGGWAGSPKGIAGVAVQIGERQWNAAYGLDTPSVAERLPGVAGADRAGYRLAIDTSGWEPGPRIVTIAAFDREGGRSAVEGAIEIRPFGGEPLREPPDGVAASEEDEVALTLDSPAIEAGTADVDGALDVRGWADAKAGIEAVIVTLDGAVQYEALRPIARPDLLHRLGRERALDAGFALRIDPVDCPPGRYRLMVSALSRDGRAAGIECELTCRAAGPSAVTNVELADEARVPQPRADGELAEMQRTWESRALLAESDAALCRAEARLAAIGEQRARRELRDAEDGIGAPAGRLRAELATARQAAAGLRAELATSEQTAAELCEELATAQRDAAELREQRDSAAGRQAALEASLSWRLTRPLRAAKRALRGRSA